MRFAPHDILQVERVGLQTGRGNRLRQRRGIHREKLGLHEGPGGGKLREQLNHFLAHRLCGRDPSILIRRQARVGGQARQRFLLGILKVHRLLQPGRRLAQRALERGGLADVAGQLRLGRPPGVVGRVQIGEIPLVGVGGLFAGRLLSDSRHRQQTGKRDGNKWAHMRHSASITEAEGEDDGCGRTVRTHGAAKGCGAEPFARP